VAAGRRRNAVAFFLVSNFVVVPMEEDGLQRTFGAAYAAYRSVVRRWL